MPLAIKPSRTTALLMASILLATFLRFYRLEAQSFWNDEGNSARLAERSIPLILAGAAGDIHPPGYYLLLAAWRAALGHSEFALRGLSAFAGVVLVALVYRLGRRYFDEPAALAAAFFAALHPALVYYGQEARMYSLAAALGAGAFWAAGRWLDAAGRPRVGFGRLSAPVALLTAAGLYAHYSFAFIVLAVNLAVLAQAWRRRSNAPGFAPDALHAALRWLAVQLAALLLFAPWLSIAIRHVTTWPSARGVGPSVESAAGVVRWLTFGPAPAPEGAALAVAVTAGLALLAVWRRGRPLAPLIWLLLPAGLTLGLGLFSQPFAKFLIVAVPAWCLLAGNGAAGLFAARLGDPASLGLLSRRGVGLRAIGVLSLVFGGLAALAMGLTLTRVYFDPAYARADYRAMARYLDSIRRPGDAVLLNAPNQWEVFTYYHPDTGHVYPVARSRPLDVPAQIAELEGIAAAHDRLFAIYWGDAQSDPARVVESWLNENTFKAYDRWYADVRLAAYGAAGAAGERQARTDALFGDSIVLEGYALNAREFAPGDILQLTLFWHARAPVTSRYKVFVHLVGDRAAPPLAQHDGEPGGGLAITTTWPAGQTVRDNHGVYLPPDLPPGEYWLLAGLYGAADGVRLTMADGGDSLLLSAIRVR